ncbi:probable NAD(P)H-dependent D-xylose reductase xyl1 [Aspergillus terreus]|uniref:Probable NAD(P)H-dependent D-xylose reductase xyl1 n=1 Tax=Aspergillus terreus TaxID=33178 RepID=A0A5M3YVM9_ASPTE|nr:hypothetical protein ATETN484_0004071700 [Aspergillus terreus]GFF13785.1 probable NAD(P)H-dependent D-xylose reductase xyl1 [Aspergillus terreus]
MASSLARLAAQAHSIHITTTPMPRNLSESKLILSALQRFGEVVTFRNLKYDPTNTSTKRTRATIAVYESADAAHRALAASPLRIPLPSISASTSTSVTHADSNSNSESEGYLVCDIQPARHNHHSAMRRSPFHGPFRVDRDSHVFRDLAASGVPVAALADVSMARKEGVSEAVRRRVRRENERLGAGSLQALYLEGMRARERDG